MPLHIGSEVIVKKGSIPAIIREALGPKTWKIELVDSATGKPKGLYQHPTKSQQLRNPRPDEFPKLTGEGAGNNEEIDLEIEEGNEQGVEVVTVLDNSDTDADTTPVSIQTNNESDTVSIHSRTSNTESKENTPERQNQGSGRSQEEEDSSCDQESEKADEASQEDVPNYVADMLEDGDAEKHKEKFELYLAEKNALINEEWTVEKTAKKVTKLTIGSLVQERSGEKRYGRILLDDREEPTGPPLWSVKFDGTDSLESKIPSTRLKQITDKRIFKWRMIADHVPSDPVRQHSIHGVANFDFAGRFDDARLEGGNEDDRYDYPFLSLLQHLWPGSWTSQLTRLNHAIENQNDALNRNRKISAVSQKEWWVFWGLIFAACPAGKGGEKLFQPKQGWRRFIPKLDLSMDEARSMIARGFEGKRS